MADEAVDPLDAAVEEFNAQPDEVEVEEPTSETEEAAPESQEAAEEEESVQGEESEEKPTKAQIRRNPRLQKILDKYGGDEDKLVDAIYHQWNSGSEQHKRMNQLEQALEALKSKQRAAPAEPTPDILEVQEDITALNEEAKDNQQSMSGLLGKMDKLNAKIYRTQGKLENAEDFDKARLEAQETGLKQELDSVVRDYQSRERDSKRMLRDYAKLQHRLDRVTKAADSDRAKEATQEVEDAKTRADAYRDFITTVEEYQGRYNFPNPKRVSDMVRSELSTYIDSLPADHPAIDISAKASEILDEFVEEIGAVKSKKFVTASKNKAASLPKGRPTSAGASPPPARVRAAKTADEARAHAERILGT